MHPSEFVCEITLDTGERIEIRRLEGGALIGIDGSWLEQLDDDEIVYSPIDGEPVEV